MYEYKRILHFAKSLILDMCCWRSSSVPNDIDLDVALWVIRIIQHQVRFVMCARQFPITTFDKIVMESAQGYPYRQTHTHTLYHHCYSCIKLLQAPSNIICLISFWWTVVSSLFLLLPLIDWYLSEIDYILLYHLGGWMRMSSICFFFQ